MKKTTYFYLSIFYAISMCILIVIREVVKNKIGFQVPYKILFLIEILFIIYTSNIFTHLHYKKYNQASNYGSHGTSRFQRKDESEKNYKYRDNSFFIGVSSIKEAERGYKFNQTNGYYKYAEDGTNNQFLVLGPPGSEKTTSFILPNVLKILNDGTKRDIIITDPKQEIKNLTEKEAIKQGYDVYVLDFLDLEKGDGINLLKYIESEDDVNKLASKITECVFKNSNEQNSFWRDNVQNTLILLISLYMYDRDTDSLKNKNIGLSDLISKNMLEYIFTRENEIIKIGGTVFMAFMGLKTACKSKETIGNIEATIYSKLTLYANQNIKKKLSSDIRAIPIEDIGKKIVTSDVYKKIKNEKEELLKILNNKIDIAKNKTNSLKSDLQTKAMKTIIQIINNDLEINAIDTLLTIKEYSAFKSDFDDIKKFLLPTENIKQSDNILKQTDEKLKEIDEKLQEYLLEVSKKYDSHIKKLDGVKEKPIILYIVMNDDDFTYNSVINLLFSLILSTIYKTAKNIGINNVKLENNVTIIAEEFCTIGYIEELVNKLGNMRGRNIFIFLIIQSLSQLRDVYKKKDKNIISQCDNKIVLGVNDTDTAKEIEETLGNQTIEVVNKKAKSSLFNQFSIFNNHNNENYTGRSLLFKSELMQYDNKKGIFIQKGKKPLEFFKCQYKYWEK